jgi:Spy/CpxP family protein refolding chaperone
MIKFIQGNSLTGRTLLMAGVLAAACGVFCAQANGQGRGGMRQRGGGDQELTELTQLLSLTSDQQTQVKTLLTDQRQQMQALHNSAAGSDASDTSQPTMQEQMQTIRKNTNDKITALLDDDQKTKFAAWLEQRQGQQHGQGGGQQGGGQQGGGQQGGGGGATTPPAFPPPSGH